MSELLEIIFRLGELIAELENLAAIKADMDREIEQYISIFDLLPSKYQSRLVMLINESLECDDEIISLKPYTDRLEFLFKTLLNIMKVVEDEEGNEKGQSKKVDKRNNKEDVANSGDVEKVVKKKF